MTRNHDEYTYGLPYKVTMKPKDGVKLRKIREANYG